MITGQLTLCTLLNLTSVFFVLKKILLWKCINVFLSQKWISSKKDKKGKKTKRNERNVRKAKRIKM